MKKFLMLSSILLLLSSFSIISYIIIEAKEEVLSYNNYLEEQQEKDSYLTPYGYTMEEANVIVDPYNISPLTALILFETEQEEEITIKVIGKDETTTITNTFESTKKHYIPVYGLYPDTENEVILKSSKKEVKYKIKTQSLPTTITKETVVNDNDTMTFINKDDYLYAIDKNNDIRWYLKGNYKYNCIKLENGNYLIPTTTLNTESYPIGLIEIDLFGKIYKQYNIENGYYGSVIENETSYYILSKNLIEIDKQTGYLLNKKQLKDKYDEITYNKENNNINLLNKITTLSIDLNTKEELLLKEENTYTQKEINSKLYTTTKNYKIINGIVFDSTSKTKESQEKIFLVGYKEPDKNYKSYNIEITKDQGYLKITGNFNNEKVYLILDKFMDKRIYDINNNYTMINKESLSGKYNIYIKINDTIYKTNKYVNF